jgi:hypothetical protein
VSAVRLCPSAPDRACDDAPHLDNNIDSTVTVVSDILSFNGHIGTTPGELEWSQRLDLNADGFITVVGDVLSYSGIMGESCT